MPRHSLTPKTIDPNTWFYDDAKGILVVHEVRYPNGALIKTDQFIIPWRKVMSAVNRHCTK